MGELTGRTISPKLPQHVSRAFDTFPEGERDILLSLRELIFDVAAKTPGVGPLEETLKWGEPAYLTSQSKSGSTVRLGIRKGQEDEVAIFFICSTTLISEFREQFGDTLVFDGNRAIVLQTGARLPRKTLASCLARALTYKVR